MATLNFPRSRSIGNAQSRNPNLPNAPAYGNTTNPNGAQTAAQGFSYDMQGRLTGVPSALQSVAPTVSNPIPQGVFSPSMAQPYAGGNVAQLAQDTRNAGIKQYYSALGGQFPQSQNVAVSPNQMIPRIAPYPAGGIASAVMGGAGLASSALRGQSTAGQGLPQVPRAQFGSMPNGQMIPREPMSPAQQAEWARARNEAGGTLVPPRGATGAWDSPAPAADLALAAKMDALTAASQAANPPRQQAPVPIEQFSTAANALRAQEAARQQNRYGSPADPNRLLPQQKYDIARQSALAAQAGGPAADPTGIGRRFGANTPLGMEADQITRDQAAKDRGEGVFIQEGGYGSPQQFLGFNATPAMALAAAQQSALNRPQERAAWKAKADARRMQQQTQNPELFAKQEARRNQQAAFVDAQLPQTGRKSALSPQPGDQTLNNPPQRKSLTPQSPEKAAESVRVLVENNKYLKGSGLTPESTPAETVSNLSNVDLTQMTSDQKFEAARAFHDYMLSQVESGGWSIPENAGSETMPETLLIGLNAMRPGNKQEMVNWFEDFIQRSRELTGTAGAYNQSNNLQNPRARLGFGNLFGM